MKNIMKRTTIALLTASLLFVLVPAFSSETGDFGIAEPVYAADDGVYRKLMSLQEKFPDGKYWNHIVPASEQGGNCHNEAYADSVTDYPCANHKGQAETGQYDCNYFDGGLRCCGFARKVFYDLFGEREKSIESQKHNGTEGISVGDFVSFNTTEHYAIVLGISGQTLTLVQCNLDQMGANYNCMISWGRTCSASEIAYYVHSNNYDAVNRLCETHTWDTGKVTKKATCTTDGEKFYTCKVCGETRTEIIKASHKYKVKAVKKATLKKNGSKKKVCKVCGHKTTSVIPRPVKFKLSKKKYVYNGKARKPGVTVTDAKGNTIKSKYYTVSYSSNKKAGKARVTVKFKRNYSGIKKLAFKIIPEGTVIKRVTGISKKIKVVWKKKSGISGYQLQVAAKSDFSGKTTINVKGSKKVSKVVKKLKAGTKYFVRIRTYKTVGKSKYYSKWSKVKIATTKAEPARMVVLKTNTTYKGYDVTGDDKADTLRIVGDTNSEGYVSYLKVKVNGEVVLTKKYSEGIVESDPATKGYPQIKYVRLSNKKPLLYLHFSTYNGYYAGGWVYQYASPEMELLLLTSILTDRLYEQGSLRPAESLDSVSGNDLIFKISDFEGRLEKYRFRYKNGELVEITPESPPQTP